MMEQVGAEWMARVVWEMPGGVWGGSALAAGVVAVTLLSYFFTLRRLCFRQRAVLSGMRLLGGALFLLCLANPRRVEEKTTLIAPKNEKTLVLFDTSSSMTVPGLLGASRLQDALSLWRRIDVGANEVHLLHFDRAMAPCGAPEQVEAATFPRDQLRPTHLAETLAAAVARVEGEGFHRLICFTDGIDTAEDTAEGAVAAAVAGCSARIEMVAADTELAMKRFVGLTRLEAPNQVLENARAPVAALTAYSNLTVSDELTAVFSDATGREIHRETAKRGGAGGTALFRCELPAAGCGTRGFRLTILLNDAVVESAYWSVETVAREQKRILLYQGTYDWAARFFKNALGRNAARTELEVRTRGARQGVTEFPAAEELANYDAVFLLNLERSAITAAMEVALTEYLGAGGGVLFITGNPLAAAEFANSPLEALLPVEFENNLGQGARADAQTSRFRSAIEGYRQGVNDRAEALLISQKEENFRSEPMTEFTLTPAGTASPIFRRPDGGVIVPRFLDSAVVRDLKPGAQALATGVGADGTMRVLFAAQRYGRGRAAVLATDPLWRWRLALPSESRDFEYFWENLAGWLGDAGSISRGGWRLDSVAVTEHTPMALRFRAAGLSDAEVAALRFHAVGPDKTEYELELRPGAEPGIRQGEFTPSEAGVWQLCAGDFAPQWFTVTAGGGVRELEQLSLDENVFQALAQNSNVRVHRLSELAAAPDRLFDADPAAAADTVHLTESRETALWWRGDLFAAFLMIYLAELLLRRKWRMV